MLASPFLFLQLLTTHFKIRTITVNSSVVGCHILMLGDSQSYCWRCSAFRHCLVEDVRCERFLPVLREILKQFFTENNLPAESYIVREGKLASQKCNVDRKVSMMLLQQ
ncbi:unnamed protein product [Calypogeia fissa]